jgi:hypothetical protein
MAGQPYEVAVYACHWRLSRDPGTEIPALRREAGRLATLASRLPEIDRRIAESTVNVTPAAPDDPALPCCAFCGSADSALAAEDGFAGDSYCTDTRACVARHAARTASWPVPEHLAGMKAEAESARTELAAMREAAAAFAEDAGRLCDEALLLAIPALRLPPALPRRPARAAQRQPPRPRPASAMPAVPGREARPSGPGPVVLRWHA